MKQDWGEVPGRRGRRSRFLQKWEELQAKGEQQKDNGPQGRDAIRRDPHPACPCPPPRGEQSWPREVVHCTGSRIRQKSSGRRSLKETG